MKTTTPILEARWIEGTKDKPSRWYCGLHSCTFWLAEYRNHVYRRWYSGDQLFHVLVLPEGFTKRIFQDAKGKYIVCAKTGRGGQKLEVNRNHRLSIEALKDESRNPEFNKTYDEVTEQLKREKRPQGQLVILGSEQEYLDYQSHAVALPTLIKCSNCQRISVIRKLRAGQTEERYQAELARDQFSDESSFEPLAP